VREEEGSRELGSVLRRRTGYAVLPLPLLFWPVVGVFLVMEPGRWPPDEAPRIPSRLPLEPSNLALPRDGALGPPLPLAYLFIFVSVVSLSYEMNRDLRLFPG
jgi:hypothetical protein